MSKETPSLTECGGATAIRQAYSNALPANCGERDWFAERLPTALATIAPSDIPSVAAEIMGSNEPRIVQSIRDCLASSSADPCRLMAEELRRLSNTQCRIEFGPAAPKIAHPIFRQQERVCLLTYIRIRAAGATQPRVVPVVLQADGRGYTSVSLPGYLSLADLKLELPPAEALPVDKLCCATAIECYRLGHRPQPADVFRRLTIAVELFVDFRGSLQPARACAQLLALFSVASYFLPVFKVATYLWFIGEYGAGKSSAMKVLSRLSCMAAEVLSSSTFAALRDTASAGAVLLVDELESVKDRQLRTLLLGGHRIGASIRLKTSARERPKEISGFGFKAFAGINGPGDDVLGSRCILMPIAATNDPLRAALDPEEDENWIESARELCGQQWLLALSHLEAVKDLYSRVPEIVGRRLMGRKLEPWRPILAVTLWLERDHGVIGLFDNMMGLAQQEAVEKRANQPPKLLTPVLRVLLEQASGTSAAAERFETMTSDVTDHARALVQAEALDLDARDITSRKVGRTIARLRISEPLRDQMQTRRGHIINIHRLIASAQAYGIPLPAVLNFLAQQERRPENACQTSGPAVSAVSAITVPPSAAAQAQRSGNHPAQARRLPDDGQTNA